MALEKYSSILDLLSVSGSKVAISIRSFEVASTICRCSKLLESVFPENIRFIKTDILHSKGVQQLVSTDMEELLTIAAADKWEEYEMLCGEVIRHGDLCGDPQRHNLVCFLGRCSESGLLVEVIYKRLKEPQKLMVNMDTLAQYTSELYHQLNAYSRFEQDYRRKLEEVATLQLFQRGESLSRLQSELKHQRKLLKSLKKKSLWFLSLDEVVKVLVDIVVFIRLQIYTAFGDQWCGLITRRFFGTYRYNMSACSRLISQEHIIKPEKLGVAGLALHYANIITLINKIASRPTSLSANMRNTLYRWLPTPIKAELPYKLWTVEGKEMLTIAQIKDEMEKTLRWLVPLASNTIKAHQGFRPRVKDSFDSNEIVERTEAHYYIMRLQTLYHADKMKIDSYIIELLMWLHYLIQHVIGSASWSTGTTVTEEYS